MSVYRTALVLAVLIVGIGLVATTVEVIDGVAHSRVTFTGKVDVSDVYPTRPKGPAREYGRLTSAEGVVEKPHAKAGELALWAIGELAPWVLGVVVLALLWPIVRAAERGDPFRADATRRLSIAGQLLLVGIPLYAVYLYGVSEALSGGSFIGPVVSPHLTISVWHFLPGVLVLVLAGVFRRGADLRDFEQHAI